MKRAPEAEELAQIQARRSDRARKDASARRDRSAAPPDLEHQVQLHDLSAPRLVALRYRLEEQLGAIGSVSGQQLERLRLGLPGGHPMGAAEDGRLRLLYQDVLTLLHAAGLNPAQEQVLRLRYGTTAGVMVQERYVKPGEAEPCESDAGPGPDGTQLVRGLVARMPSFVEVAEALNRARGLGSLAFDLSARQVQRLADSALDQVRQAQRERAHRASLEG